MKVRINYQVTIWDIFVIGDNLYKMPLGTFMDKPNSYVSRTKTINKSKTYPDAVAPIGCDDHRIYCIERDVDAAAKWLLSKMQERRRENLRLAQKELDEITALLDQHYPQYE